LAQAMASAGRFLGQYSNDGTQRLRHFVSVAALLTAIRISCWCFAAIGIYQQPPLLRSACPLCSNTVAVRGTWSLNLFCLTAYRFRFPELSHHRLSLACNGPGVHQTQGSEDKDGEGLDNGSLSRELAACWALADPESGPNSEVRAGSPAIVAFAAAGWTNAVNLLLANGTDPNTMRPQDGATPLIAAASNGQLEAARTLLDAGADPCQSRPEDDVFPLLFAASNGHGEIVKLLLAHVQTPRSEANRKAAWGKQPAALTIAAQGGHTVVTSALLAVRAEPNIRVGDGLTPLVLASEFGHAGTVQELLSARADPDLSRADGATPLIRASAGGHANTVVLLLQSRADPSRPAFPELEPQKVRQDVRDHSGATPLLAASAFGHVPVARLLLRAGVSPNQARDDGGTPLMAAATRGHEAILKLLLAAGADPKQTTKVGGTALQGALGAGHYECAEILQQ